MPDKFLSHPLLAEILRFKPFPQGDPIPPWIFERLDKARLGRLALVELELRKSILDAQLKANAQAVEIVKGLAK